MSSCFNQMGLREQGGTDTQNDWSRCLPWKMDKINNMHDDDEDDKDDGGC